MYCSMLPKEKGARRIRRKERTSTRGLSAYNREHRRNWSAPDVLPTSVLILFSPLESVRVYTRLFHLVLTQLFLTRHLYRCVWNFLTVWCGFAYKVTEFRKFRTRVTGRVEGINRETGRKSKELSWEKRVLRYARRVAYH